MSHSHTQTHVFRMQRQRQEDLFLRAEKKREVRLVEIAEEVGSQEITPTTWIQWCKHIRNFIQSSKILQGNLCQVM
ncbi:hypothetical protein scyTo_0011914 [Scyliorhinus torazame]|uniref:Uncharacterized protein n=1 Tax=Scyliorhinus torazame TaxID=75743 RepID=A0A401NY25_SCYTO|nr:hypothetical protein [Scyliorhinus torazame]